MNWKEMCEIAERRTKGKWRYDTGNWEVEDEDRSTIFNHTYLDDRFGNPIAANSCDGHFVEMCSNNWDRIKAVVDAAKNMTKSSYYEGYYLLDKALEELERE